MIPDLSKVNANGFRDQQMLTIAKFVSGAKNFVDTLLE
jgi:hypothetical protein